MKKIEHIVFDLGNVILNIDYQKTIEEFNKLGISNASSLYSQSSQSSIFDLLETGNISDQKFILEIKKLCQKTTSKEIIKAWNAILLEIPNERILLLNKLKTNFNIFLLSNTNSIHIKELMRATRLHAMSLGHAIIDHHLFEYLFTSKTNQIQQELNTGH